MLVGLDELLATGTANRPVRSRSGHRSVRWQRVALAAVLAVGFALVLLMSGLLVVLPAPETGAPAVAELGMPEQVGEINSRAERAAAAVSDAATSMVAA